MWYEYVLGCGRSVCVMMNPTANQCLHACLFQIYIVYNKRTGKPRGYAFIEYEHERDMHCEYQCWALSQNHSVYDHMLMRTDQCDVRGGSSSEPPFLYSIWMLL